MKILPWSPSGSQGWTFRPKAGGALRSTNDVRYRSTIAARIDSISEDGDASDFKRAQVPTSHPAGRDFGDVVSGGVGFFEGNRALGLACRQDDPDKLRVCVVDPALAVGVERVEGIAVGRRF